MNENDNVKMTHTIDMTPSPKIYRVLSRQEFELWQCLAELIDNSIDGFTTGRENKMVLATDPQVSITGKLGEYISIVDNASGMDEETLDVFGLKQGEVRENVTTSGIDIHSLPKGQRLSLGDQVVLEITGFCDPCEFIEDKEQGLRDRMTDRRGMLTHVVEGGVVNAGDSVKPL